MKKPRQEIQVFLTGETTAEIVGYLVDIEPLSSGLHITSEDDTGYRVRHIIPMSQVRMIRIYDESDD